MTPQTVPSKSWESRELPVLPLRKSLRRALLRKALLRKTLLRKMLSRRSRGVLSRKLLRESPKRVPLRWPVQFPGWQPQVSPATRL
jgi:hypothetical protein